MDGKRAIINDKIISIPPYISTSWGSVSALHMRGADLVFTLKEGPEVVIPQLPTPIISDIFSAHAQYMQVDGQLNQMGRELRAAPLIPKSLAALTDPSMANEQIFRIGIGSLEEMGQAMQHNPDQKNMPPLPPELLGKISSIIKMIAPQDADISPKAEPHCNCMHCQIARAVHSEESAHDAPAKEEEPQVLDEELAFSQFEIRPTGDNLYTVQDKLAPHQRFTVHLGDPVGCTCGKSGCEHLVAVLKS